MAKAPRIELSTARALVANERLWPRIMERCFSRPSGRLRFHDFPSEDGSRLALVEDETFAAVANWLEVIARAKELRAAADASTVKAYKEAYGEAYPEALRYVPYFAKWHLPSADGRTLLATALRSAPRGLVPGEPLADETVPLAAVMKLLQLKFPEVYALCCS